MTSDYRKSPPLLKNPFPEGTGFYRCASTSNKMIYLVTDIEFKEKEDKWRKKTIYNRCEIKVIDSKSNECVKHLRYVDGDLQEFYDER